MQRTRPLYESIWALLALIGLQHAAILVDAADSIAWTIPSTVLSNASQVLDPRFAGFGIEFSNLFSYTGTAASPNTFSQNLIANLKAVAGVAPLFRIGGNTQDYMIYDSSFTGSYFGQNSDATEEPQLTDWVPFNEYNYGDELFKALGTFPTTSQFIFGLNLAYDLSDYITRITSTASAVIDALGDNVYSFEIGNEPDLYDSTAPYRVAPQYNGTAWSGSVYSQEWVTRASAIQSQVYPSNSSTHKRFSDPPADRIIHLKRVRRRRRSGQRLKFPRWRKTASTRPMRYSIIISTITFTTLTSPDTHSREHT
jgi:hypothetical protein